MAFHKYCQDYGTKIVTKKKIKLTIFRKDANVCHLEAIFFSNLMF